MTEASWRVREFSGLSQAMANAPDEDGRLKLAAEAAIALVDRCGQAGISVNVKGVLRTLAASDEVVRRANELQSDLGEGPCMDVDRTQNALVSTALSQEQRWPRWAPRAHAELGVESMMSLLIYTDAETFGSLCLYARADECFDADDVVVGQAIAAQLALTISAEREIDQLGLAMHNRLAIGQAEGIVMERLGVTAEQAFDYLRRVSSHHNKKIAVIAAEIVATRRLLDIDQ